MSLDGTYSGLKASVASWLNRANLTSNIPDFIALGEARVYKRLRIRAMEAALSGTISSGVLAIPSDYVGLKHARIDGGTTQFLRRKPAAWIYEFYPTRAADRKPKFIATDQGNFIFGPFPDTGYSVLGTYYKRLTALSDSNTSNWFTVNAPGVLLFGALCEAEPFIKNDDRLELWKAKFEEEITLIDDEEDAEQTSGGGQLFASVQGAK